MPNVCVIARANGEIESTEVDEWPDFRSIQTVVGGMFAEVPTSFRMEFDETWGDEAGEQKTVVYCNQNAAFKGLGRNNTGLAATMNRELGSDGPLLGDLLIVSGDDQFMALQD